MRVHRHLKSYAAPPGAGTMSGAGQSSAILVSWRGPLSAVLSHTSQLASARSRSTITTTLPSVPLPDFSDCSPSLIASTVLSVFGVADAEERLWDRKCLLNDNPFK